MPRSALAARTSRCAIRLGLGVALALPQLTLPVSAESRIEEGADRQAALKAELALSDAAGQPLSSPLAGDSFVLKVALRDSANGEVPVGINLEGWIRPVQESDLPCLEAARAFRVTRRIPAGGIDLNGVLLAAFNRDGSFGIIDPRLDLATANMLAAGSLGDGPPRQVMADPVSQRLYILGQDHRLRILSAQGKLSEVTGLEPNPRLAALLPDQLGGIWLAGGEADGRGLFHLNAQDQPRRVLQLERPILGLRRISPKRMVIWSENEAQILDSTDGALVQGIARDLKGGILTLDGVTLTDKRGTATSFLALLGAADAGTGYLLWGDAPELLQPISLPAKASRVGIDPDSGKVLYWDPQGAVSIVDPVSGQVAAALDIHEGISEVAFAGNAAFLATTDDASVAVIDLPSATPGKAPAVQIVRLGTAAPAEEHLGTGLVQSLRPSPQVLAVHRASQTGFIVDARSSMGEAPPMSAVRLRGGLPDQIAVIDRSFRRNDDASFSTRATLPEPGRYELVLTTGIGGLSTCFPIEAKAPPGWVPPADQSRRSAYRLALLTKDMPSSGQPVTLTLGLQTAKGEARPVTTDEISVTAVEYGWRQPARGELQPDGSLALKLTFPSRGLYLIEMPSADARLVLDVP